MASKCKRSLKPWSRFRPGDDIFQVLEIIGHCCVFIITITFSERIRRIKTNGGVAMVHKRFRHHLNMRLLFKPAEAMHHKRQAGRVFRLVNNYRNLLPFTILDKLFLHNLYVKNFLNTVLCSKALNTLLQVV